MKPLPKLSETNEKRISDALMKANDLVESGQTPNDAITKVATDMQMPAGHVRLMVHAYNNGRTLAQIQNNETLTEKAATFPLADASDILERMFPERHKSASEQHHDDNVSADYDVSPKLWLQRKAAATKPMPAPAKKLEPFYPAPSETPDIKAANSRLDTRRQFAEARVQAVKAAYDVVHSLDALADYFRGNNALPLKSVTANAVCVHGDKAAKLLEKVATDKTVARLAAKAADQDHPVDWTKPPYSLITNALNSATTFNEKLATAKEAETAYNGLCTNTKDEFVGESRPKTFTGYDWAPFCERAGGLADFFSKQADASALTGILGKYGPGFARFVEPSGEEELIAKQMDRLADPKHEDALRRIRIESMINELMLGDPIISTHPPEAVVSAFNYLSEVAPLAMQQRVMAQSLLRKYLEQEGAIDQFDINHLVDIDAKLRDANMSQGLLDAGYQPGAARELGPLPAEVPKRPWTQSTNPLTDVFKRSEKPGKPESKPPKPAPPSSTPKKP